MFQNRVLRKTFGSKAESVRGEQKKLHNGELHDLCFSPNMIRMVK